jgi:hypothetical protein
MWKKFENAPVAPNEKYLLRCVWSKGTDYYWAGQVEYCMGFYSLLGDDKRVNGWTIEGKGFLHHNPQIEVTHFKKFEDTFEPDNTSQSS